MGNEKTFATKVQFQSRWPEENGEANGIAIECNFLYSIQDRNGTNRTNRWLNYYAVRMRPANSITLTLALPSVYRIQKPLFSFRNKKSWELNLLKTIVILRLPHSCILSAQSHCWYYKEFSLKILLWNIFFVLLFIIIISLNIF